MRKNHLFWRRIPLHHPARSSYTTLSAKPKAVKPTFYMERKHGKKHTYFGANSIVFSSIPDTIRYSEIYLLQAQSPCRKHLYSSNHVWTTFTNSLRNTFHLFLAFTSSFAGLTNCSLSSLSSITVFSFFCTASDCSNPDCGDDDGKL